MDGMKLSMAEMSVPGLLRLARRNAAALRRAYAALGEALVDGATADITLTDWQRAILSQLLRQVVGDIYASLRWMVLAEMEDGGATGTGHAGMTGLAADSETRVFSLMSKRGLLQDTALIEAITHRLYQHQLERATRPPDRNRWTNTPTLDSPGDFFDRPIAAISPVNRRIAAYVIDRSRRMDRYGHPVLAPADIEPRLYERLHWRTAAALRHMLADRSDEPPERLDARIEKAAIEAIRHAQAVAAAPTSTAEAARALDEAGLVSVETVHRLLKAGEIPLFEETFSRLAGIRPVLLRRLLYEAGGECFAVLTRALDVELDQALAIFALIRSGSTKQFRREDDEDAPLRAVYDAVSRDDARSVRACWMRQPDFAAALWEAEPDRAELAGNAVH